MKSLLFLFVIAALLPAVAAAPCAVDSLITVSCTCDGVDADPSDYEEHFCCDYDGSGDYELGPVRCGHPRIWFNEEDVQTLRDEYDNPSNPYLWGSYGLEHSYCMGSTHNARGPICNAFFYLLTGDSQYAELALDTEYCYFNHDPEHGGDDNCVPNDGDNDIYVSYREEMMNGANHDYPPDLYTFDAIGKQLLMRAVVFDWLYDYPGFTQSMKDGWIEWFNSWRRSGGVNSMSSYETSTFFNGQMKALRGQVPLTFAIYGENPIAYQFTDFSLPVIENRIEHLEKTWEHPVTGLRAGGYYPAGNQYAPGMMGMLLESFTAYHSATESDILTNRFSNLKNLMRYGIYTFYEASYDELDDPGGEELKLMRDEYGKNEHGFQARQYGFVASLFIMSRLYPGDPFSGYVKYLFNNNPNYLEEYSFPVGGSDNVNLLMMMAITDALTGDQITTRNYDELPLAYQTEPYNVFFMRSNWNLPDEEPVTYATFKASELVWFNQNQFDQGTFNIFSHGGDLAVDSGSYDGVGGAASQAYSSQTIAHNSLLILDPKERCDWGEITNDVGDGCNLVDGVVTADEANSGGQRAGAHDRNPSSPFNGQLITDADFNTGANTLHDISDILAFDNSDYEYTYIAADITRAYASPAWTSMYDFSSNSYTNWPENSQSVRFRPKVDQVEREFVYVRNPTDLDKEFFVVFDRINDLGSDYGEVFNKTWLIHSLDKPQFPSSPIQVIDSGKYEVYGGNRFSLVHEQGKLFVKTLLPATVKLTMIGSPWDCDNNTEDCYDYYAYDQNWPNNNDEYAAGSFRVEVSPANQYPSFHNFLTVLHPTSSSLSSSPADSAQLVTVMSGAIEGAVIDSAPLAHVVVFSRYGDVQDFVGYRFSAANPTDHIVVNLDSYNTYSLSIDGSQVGSVSANDQGVAFFSIPATGSVEIDLVKEGAATCSDVGAECAANQGCNGELVNLDVPECCIGVCSACTVDSPVFWSDAANTNIEGGSFYAGTQVFSNFDYGVCNGVVLAIAIFDDADDSQIGQSSLGVTQNNVDNQKVAWNSFAVGGVDTDVYFRVSVPPGGSRTSGLITIGPDNDPPGISSVSSTVDGLLATISWLTDELSNSTVRYGTSSGSYPFSSSDESFVTSHSVGVVGLSSLTTYFFVVESCDSSGNCAASSERSFTTADVPDLDWTPIDDTWIGSTYGDQDIVHGSDGSLYLDGSAGGTESYVLMRFDLSMLGANEVDSAVLRLYTQNAAWADGEADVVSIYPLARADWLEDQATFYEYRTGSNWAGYTGVGQIHNSLLPPTDYHGYYVLESLQVEDDQSWHSFDITGLVHHWQDGTFDPDAGFVMRIWDTMGPASSFDFVSSESADTAHRPVVQVSFATGGSCTDSDTDGYSAQGGGSCCGVSGTDACGSGADCQDGNPFINPGMSEICFNGVDDDCDGLTDQDDVVSCDPYDLDGGGAVGLSDLLFVFNGLHQLPMDHPVSGYSNDVNGDGLVDVRDVVLVAYALR